ncbi:MAG TPA: lysine 5,6-aminomutase subunit alpha, partial [Microbacterium sp.]|nr:lysine 5,6-aminomutase subunit alpha [Microbacterium sp.]
MKTSKPFVRPLGRLQIDRASVAECRSLAIEISRPIEELARTHTTVSIERACLRIAGVDGVEGEGAEAVPVPNRVVDEVKKATGLERGVLIPFFHAVRRAGGVQRAAEAISSGEFVPSWPEGADYDAALAAATRAAESAVATIAEASENRARVIDKVGEATKPWLYLIVATGNIHEDIPQAQAAAREGADVIAVIRSTGQSLLDYVPFGATTDGFAGTFATQENFRLMRAALDEVGEELGRYIRLTNYASGLCM